MEENVLFSIEADPAAAEAGFAALDGMLADFQASASEVAATAEEAGAAIDAAFSGVADAADAAAGAFSGIDAAASAAAGSMDGISASAGAAASGLDGAAASADGAAASMDAAAASADGTNAAMATLDFTKLALVGAAAGLAAGMFIKLGADGEDALTRVQALTGASQAQMDQYSNAITGMAGKYGKSVADLSGGLYDIVSVGIQGAGALNTLKVASEAAAAGGTDLHTVTSGLTSIMKAYGVQGKDAAGVMDLLLTGVRDGKASFQDYSNAIGLVATTAKGAGFSLSESTAALSTLTAVFPNARRAGMDLQHLLTTIGVNAAATGAAAKKMGLNFDAGKFATMGLQQRLQYLQDITHGNQAEMLKLTGGTAGFAAAQVLLANKSADFTRNLGDMKKATGATQNAFDTWSKSTGAHAANMTGALSALAKNFVVMTGPSITDGLDHMTGLFTMLSTVITQHGDAMKVTLTILAGALLGALVPSLTAAAIAAWGFLAPILIAAAPFIAVGAAVAGLALAVKYAYDHFAPFRTAVSGALSALKQVGAQVMSAVTPAFHQAQAALAQFGQEVMQRAGPAIRNIQAAITAAMPVIKAIWNDTWPQIQNIFSTVWGVIQGVVKVAWAIISGVIKVGLDVIGGNWKGAWSDMKVMFKGIWDGIAQILGSVLLGMRNTFLNGLRPILQAVALIPGPVGDMARKALGSINTLENGTDKSTAAMAAKTKAHAQAMKIGMLTATADMHMKAAAEFAAQAKDITAQIKNTSDPVKRHALEMKLAMVTASEQMERNAAQKAMAMAAKVGSSTQLLATQSRTHAQSMKADVGTQFEQMVTQAVSQAGQLVSQVGATLGGLAGKALGWGADMVKSLASGISGALGHVTSAVGGIANAITAHLHFSKPDVGPLADVDKWMPDFGQLISQGLSAQVSTVGAAASRVAGAIQNGMQGGLGALSGALPNMAGAGSGFSGLAAGVAPITAGGLYNGGTGSSFGAGGLGGASPAVLAYLAQIASGVRQQPPGASPTPANLGGITQNLGGVNISGVSDINSLYQQLNTLAGLAIENGARGATAGLGL